MAISSSLFDAPAEPVMSRSADWIAQLVSGTAATLICIIAVAFLGFLLMSGRLAIRDGIRVIVGCFVLLGAPTIAVGLLQATNGAQSPPVLDAAIAGPPGATATKLPPANYDPYAGASLRIE